jgi:hypothetical protein
LTLQNANFRKTNQRAWRSLGGHSGRGISPALRGVHEMVY